jgi:hypothetical protein
MWLLETTSLTLSTFFDDNTPYYAILSHTWGAEEVSFQDIRGPHKAISKKAGFKKIKDCCARALDAGFKYVWIDTCCIDKTNSTELSEAINSMFRWYENAVTCYAYLEDVKPNGLRFTASRWFKRGWTLQELIAPADVLFFDSYWNEIGSRASLAEQIENITGVPVGLLLMNTSLRDHCVAEIMCWASRRHTTRLEDRAYSLMGLFGVSMPLIYGEGENAFFRLQLEIMKTTTDHSLFAWIPTDVPGRRRGALATTPNHFNQSGNYRRLAVGDESSFEMTNLGLRISLPCVLENGSSRRFACLQCKDDSQDGLLGIWLTEVTNEEGGPLGRFYRSHLELLTRTNPLWAMFWAIKPLPTLLHIIQPDNRLRPGSSMPAFFGLPPCLVDYSDLIQAGYQLEYPGELRSPISPVLRKLEGRVVFGLRDICPVPGPWFLFFKHRHRLTLFRVEIHTINGKICSKIELDGNGAAMSDPILQVLHLPVGLPHGEGIIDHMNPQRILRPGEAVKLTAKRAIIAGQVGFVVKLAIMDTYKARDCYGLSNIMHQH